MNRIIRGLGLVGLVIAVGVAGAAPASAGPDGKFACVYDKEHPLFGGTYPLLPTELCVICDSDCLPCLILSDDCPWERALG